MKDPEFKDNLVNRDPSKGEWKQTGDYDTLLHVNDKGHPDVHGVYKELRKILDSYNPPRFSIGEIHVFEWEKWASYYGENNDELHMPFNFALLTAPWKASAIRKIVETIEQVTFSKGWPNYVFGNHDEPRIAGKHGASKARMAAMLLLTLRGTPTIYNGDEFGQINVPIPAELEKDPYGKRVPGAGRDGCRTPNQWTAGSNAGFTAEGVIPWLPVAADYMTNNMETELGNSRSILNLYRKLLAFRKSSAAVHFGRQECIDPTPEECFAYLRIAENEKIITAFNFGVTTVRLDFHHFGNLEIIISTGMDRTGLIDASKVDLSPSEGLVLRVV
jgi:alpha-glucosidase